MLKNIIGPAIQSYLKTGDVGPLDSAVEQAVGVSQKMFEDLKGLRVRLGLDKADSQAQGGSLFGNAPSIQLGIPRIEVQLPDALLTGLGGFSAAVPVFDQASRRLLEAADRLLTGSGQAPALSKRRGLT